MKKIILSTILMFSYQLNAACPNLTGTYQCVDPTGKIYTQVIKQENNPFTYIFIKGEKKHEVKYIVDNKNHDKIIREFQRPLFMQYRGSCINNTYRNEFVIDYKIAMNVRGHSTYRLTEVGFSIHNKVFLPFDNTDSNVESCKKIN